jgi:hypothetical protein
MIRRIAAAILQIAATAIVVGAIICLPGPRSARAADASEPTVEPSAELFREGLAEYDARNYRRAIDIFSRVYEDTHNAALLFNIAQASRLMGDCVKAAGMYELFVAEDPGSPDTERARGWLEKLRPCRQQAATAVGAGPRPALQLASPPPPDASSILARRAAPVSVSAAPRSHPHTAVVGLLAGASIALAGAGAFAAWCAHDLSDEQTAAFEKGGSWSSQAATVQREGQRTRTEAIVFLSAAVVSGIAAYLVHRLSSPRAPTPDR